MSTAFAWRPLALLPILKVSAFAETDKDWLADRLLDLYRRSMDHIIADLNELCSKDIHLRFADNLIRLSRAFYHVSVIGEFTPGEMSGYPGIWLDTVGDVRISMDMFRDSGDPLGTSPTKDIQPRYQKIAGHLH